MAQTASPDTAIASGAVRVDRLAGLLSLPNVLIGVLTFLLIFELVSFVYVGRINRDEGWYLYAGKLVYEGQLPYRDFAYFQMPLLPYIYGLPQALFGQSLVVGRFTALACSAAAIAVSMYICARLAGRWAVVTLLALTAVSPFVMLAYTQARGEASGALIAVAAFALLVMPPRDPLARLIAAPLVLLLGTALRLNFLPAFVLATAFVWLTTPAPRNTRLAAALAIAIPALLLLVLPLAFAGERYWFNVWLAQASRGDQFTGDRSSFGDSMSFVLFWLSYSLERMALAVVATALIAATLYMRWRDGWRPDWRSQRLCLEEIEAICVVLALAVFLPFLGLNTFEPRYVVTSFAVLVVGVAIIVGRSSFSTADRWSTAAAGILAIALLLLPVGANFYPEAVDVREPDIDGLQNGARAVRELVPADGTLLTFDTPLAVEARRDLTPGLTMAQFSFWPRMDIDDARRRHVVTGETLLQLDARQPPALIALTTHDLAYLDAGDANFDAPRGIALLPDTNGVTHCYQLRDTIERWAEGIEPLYLYMLTPLEDCIGG